MPFEFVAADEKWTSEDYTLDEMVAIEKRTGVKWPFLDFASEAEWTRAGIIQWFARADAEGAEKRAGALLNRQIQVRKIDDDRPVEFDNGVPVVDPKVDTAGPGTT